MCRYSRLDLLVCVFISYLSYLTALLHVGLINIAYLMACIFIRSTWPVLLFEGVRRKIIGGIQRHTYMTLHFLNDVVNDVELTRKSIITSWSRTLVWRVNQLVNCIYNTRFMSFDIKFTRLGFQNACQIARAFSIPFLVNLKSKDIHLVFSMS